MSVEHSGVATVEFPLAGNRIGRAWLSLSAEGEPRNLGILVGWEGSTACGDAARLVLPAEALPLLIAALQELREVADSPAVAGGIR